MLGKIKKQIIKTLPLEWNIKESDLVIPPDLSMGDLSFGCFALAKKLGKNPAEVSKELEEKIKNFELKILEKVEAVGPFVNFTLNSTILAKDVLIEIQKLKEKFGQSITHKKETILIEYPSNNTHKEVHVGHLRNICLGNAIVKLRENVGYKVIPINYINDFGTHVSKCLWGLEKFHSKEKPPKNKQKWLGQIYAEASNYVKDHPETVEELKEYLRKLEGKDKKVWKLFMTTRAWSLEGFKNIFKELGLKHKTTFYEKDVKASGQKAVDLLLKKKIAQVGEGGAIIIDLSSYGLDIGLIRKSDGSGLYLTSDLGLFQIKAKKFPKVDESINLTGSEQKFYFKQMFKILELMGLKYKTTHITYELVMLPSGKMSSRLGNVILYEDIRDEALALATAETQKRHSEWNKKKIQQTAWALALGAVKFSMVKVGSNQIITFNTEEALSFDGYTGPYMQYSIARINSILKKVGVIKNLGSKMQYQELKTLFEKKLIFKLANFEEIILEAAEKNDPSCLAKYLFELAKLFSEFYENCSVLKAESLDLKVARLQLVKATKLVLEKGLTILGVPIIKEM